MEAAWVYFVDGACLGSSEDSPQKIGSYFPAQPIDSDWFNILVRIDADNSVFVQSSCSSGPFKDSLPALVEDFRNGTNTNKPYYKTWKVTLAHGANDLFQFTCHHQADAGRAYQKQHPHARVAAVVGQDRIYLTEVQRRQVDADAIAFNQTVVSGVNDYRSLAIDFR